MSKIKNVISRLMLFLALTLFLSVKTIYAATPIENCPNPIQTQATNLGTIATTLSSKSEKAIFEAKIDHLFDPSVTKWQMKFECGPEGLQQVVDASSDPASQTVTSRSVDRNRSPVGGCEFFAEKHTLLVIGDGTPRCKGTYTVQDADAHCKLTIAPTTGITAATPITVSGENITNDAQFNLFIDNNDKFSDYVKTPSFSSIRIPKEKLSPTKHTVFLRRDLDPLNLQRIAGIVNPVSFGATFFLSNKPYGPPLCPIQFTVGPNDAKPGSVITGPTAGGLVPPPKCTDQDVIDGKCASGGGKIDKGCGKDDPRGPGFITAIGCIHTNPPELIKDFLAFTVGIGGGLAFLMMLLGAFQMLTSAGNPETLNAGKDRLTNAIIGLLFVIFSVLLLQIIGVDILKIPGFE